MLPANRTSKPFPFFRTEIAPPLQFHRYPNRLAADENVSGMFGIPFIGLPVT